MQQNSGTLPGKDGRLLCVNVTHDLFLCARCQERSAFSLCGARLRSLRWNGGKLAATDWNWSRYQWWYRYTDGSGRAGQPKSRTWFDSQQEKKKKVWLFEGFMLVQVFQNDSFKHFCRWGTRTCSDRPFGVLGHFLSSLSFRLIGVTLALKYLSGNEWRWHTACLHCLESDGVTSLYHCAVSAGCTLKAT